MPNWSKIAGGGAAGALGGATLGAGIGSVVPGVGTVIGAGLGGLAGLLLGGTGAGLENRDPKIGGNNGSTPGFEQSPNKYSPEQQKVLNQLLSQGQAGLKDPYAGFQPIEDYARSKFQRESIPGIAERFTSMGGSDTRGSSDFAGMLGGAQSEFDQGLAALRSQYGHQGQQNAIQQLQLGLNPQSESIYFGKSPGVGNQLLETAGSLAGSYLGGGGSLTDLFGGRSSNAGATAKGILSKLNPQQKVQLGTFLKNLKTAGTI